MDRVLVMLGVAVAFALFQVLVSNRLAQKLMPTKSSDSFLKRLQYSVVHRGVLLALIFGVVGLLALLGVERP